MQATTWHQNNIALWKQAALGIRNNITLDTYDAPPHTIHHRISIQIMSIFNKYAKIKRTDSTWEVIYTIELHRSNHPTIANVKHAKSEQPYIKYATWTHPGNLRTNRTRGKQTIPLSQTKSTQNQSNLILNMQRELIPEISGQTEHEERRRSITFQHAWKPSHIGNGIMQNQG